MKDACKEKGRNLMSDVIIVRVTPEEKAALKEKVKELNGINLSAFIRAVCLKGAAVNIDTSHLSGLERQMRGIGTNINQIAKYCNQGYGLSEEDVEMFREAHSQLEKIVLEEKKAVTNKIESI